MKNYGIIPLIPLIILGVVAVIGLIFAWDTIRRLQSMGSIITFAAIGFSILLLFLLMTRRRR